MSEQLPSNRVDDVNKAEEMAYAMHGDMDTVVKSIGAAHSAAEQIGNEAYQTEEGRYVWKREDGTISQVRPHGASDNIAATPEEYMSHSIDKAKKHRDIAERRAQEAATEYDERNNNNSKRIEAAENIRSLTHELLNK